MAKDVYKNPQYLDESVKATQKALKDPYGGRKTFPRAKDSSANEDRASRPVKVGQGDIPSNSWLRGRAKGGESYSSFNPSRVSKNPATEGSGGRKKSPGFK